MTARKTGLRGAALAMLAAVAVTGALAQETGWHTMTGPNKSFTADMPEAPKYTEVQMKTGSGSAYAMHQYVVEQGAVAYVVQSAAYPPDVNVSNPQANLQAGLDTAAKNLDGKKWGAVNWTKHQGFTAVDATGARQGTEVRAFSVFKARQIFSLTYAGPPGSTTSPDVTRFLTSLKIAP